MRGGNLNKLITKLLANSNDKLASYLPSLINDAMHPDKATRDYAFILLCQVVEHLREDMPNKKAVVKVKSRNIKRLASQGGEERELFIVQCIKQTLNERADINENAMQCLKDYFETMAILREKQNVRYERFRCSLSEWRKGTAAY